MSPTPGPRVLPVVAAAVTAVLLAGCDSAPAPTAEPPGSTGPGPATPSATGGATTAVPVTPSATAPPATGSATGPVTGPATPSAPPGTFAIAVAGAGQVTYPVTGVSCSATAVTATATPTGGGAAGTLTLDPSAGALTVAGLPPLDGTRLSGRVEGTPVPGATVRWTGDGTGAAASLSVTCP